MAISWFKGSTSLSSKRAAMKQLRSLKRRGFHTELVNKKEGRVIVYGVKYL